MADKNKKVAFKTLGCKLNFAESSTIARDFTEKGFERVKFNEKSDVYVINTCTVTEQADKKCRQAVKKIIKNNPEAIVALIGCYAQIKPQEVAEIEGVDIVLGVDEKFKLFEYIEQFEKDKKQINHSCEIETVEHFDASYSSGDRTRSFLKIQDGCDYLCTYCTIPKARGKSRNENIKKTVKQAKKIAEKGYKEIVLTGVNIGDFGKSTGETFLDLIKELDKVEGIERYRISSIEPNLLTDEIIEFVSKSKKFLPHFHIPLQSGSNQILKLMKRRYLRERFADRINKINNLIENAFIGVDVIVGFPSETQELFNETYSFLDSLNISFLHVFSYSDRDGTESSVIKTKVSKSEISERSKLLHQLSDKKHAEFYSKNIDKTKSVLFESGKINERMIGFTDNYLKVEIPFNKNLINQITDVKLDNLKEKYLFVKE
ncbi:MAG: tRNA (N(6)-L-threonylcarbamoyladenosine(37)-C(2))-methylthiotransferase MtaB [Bacteroidales bacterium]|nr:tRNA (N(6)-L-threonylcarbamoyladenosine(37)-C(2))-methylthiotransferase MtaB [Bacteroidales bacterium]MBN2757178.1 tRNA (N(6)-L-threonylcarbamoyladenosine(37)-C(2))-methylthiotransferase MtaB [Bacteroidales bacterium]